MTEIDTEQFVLGFLAPFVVAGLVLLVAYLVSRASQWWTTWRPRTYKDADKRADLAAGMAVAHRLWVIRLPGGFIFAYRARVSRWQTDYQQAVWTVRDALETVKKENDRG